MDRYEDQHRRERQSRRDERGFIDRAGDEVKSWFGDDEAERRRREDMRYRSDDDGGRRPRAFLSDDEYSRYDRSPRFRDEGYRRPYTGRFAGRRSFGGDEGRERQSPGQGWSERWDRGSPRREFTGTASGLHDPHYSEWRSRQIDALDRDYDEYRRENQNRFENEFTSWRSTREGKRQLLGQVREHMSVFGSDEEPVGTVDCVRGDRIVLTKDESEDGRHHHISCSMVDRVDGDRVILDQPAGEAKRRFRDDDRNRGFFRDEDRESGPHILNRSFSGTY
jgi:hypothetical protein